MRAKRAVKYTKQLLEEVGIEGERLDMFNLGASDASLFTEVCNKMTERARRLGPNPLKKKLAGEDKIEEVISK